MSPSLNFAKVIAQLNNVSRALNPSNVSHTADGNKSPDEEIGSKCPILEMFYNDEDLPPLSQCVSSP